ncbi:MAG: hypothetical protein CL566_07205 [Alphaproteobacteria bacterium]|nr:hypothetical protein [Alphaproteobacteria bacterium]
MHRNSGFPLRSTLAIGGLVALTACAQLGIVVTRVDYATQYEPAEARAAGGGDHQMKVTVLGNPFDAPHATLEAAVIDSMQGSTSGIPINFAANPKTRTQAARFRVVVTFTPEAIRDPAKLCTAGEDIALAAPASGTVPLMSAFCSSDSSVSHAIARASDIDGTASEKLDALMIQLTLAMFPDENPHR